jgi:hypothetical protein
VGHQLGQLFEEGLLRKFNRFFKPRGNAAAFGFKELRAELAQIVVLRLL